MTAGDLHRLLRLAPDTPIDRLRSAYEQAMREATRAGDHQRALALSAAFDALPAPTKAQVYRNSRNSAPGSVRPTIAAAGWGGPADPPRRVRPARRRPPRRRRRWLRALAYGLGIPAIVLGGYYFSTHDAFSTAGGPGREPVVVRTRPPVQPTAGPALRVPMDAPTGPSGDATVACEPDDGSDGYLVTVPRGALVACRNGAIPEVVG